MFRLRPRLLTGGASVALMAGLLFAAPSVALAKSNTVYTWR
jgi:hypothetical protein